MGFLIILHNRKFSILLFTALLKLWLYKKISFHLYQLLVNKWSFSKIYMSVKNFKLCHPWKFSIWKISKECITHIELHAGALAQSKNQLFTTLKDFLTSWNCLQYKMTDNHCFTWYGTFSKQSSNFFWNISDWHHWGSKQWWHQVLIYHYKTSITLVSKNDSIKTNSH